MDTMKSNNTKSVTNIAKFGGRIVNYYEKGNVFIVTLAVKSTLRNGNTIRNYPKVYFFKSDNTGAEKFMLHDYVCIEAHASTSRKTRPNGAVHFSQAFIGEKIEEKKSLFEKEFGVDSPGNNFEDDINAVYLKGEIDAVEKVRDGVIRIRLNAKNKRYNNHVTVTSFNPQDLVFSPGEVITVYGRVSTSKKVHNNKNFFYENIVADKIVRSNKSSAEDEPDDAA